MKAIATETRNIFPTEPSNVAIPYNSTPIAIVAIKTPNPAFNQTAQQRGGWLTLRYHEKDRK
jgi:hypothetical protein